MNGLAEESQPTSGDPIPYPFTSYDGRGTFTREQWGQRVFDLNKDGVANYGMFPDCRYFAGLRSGRVRFVGVSTEGSRRAILGDIQAAGLS